LTPRIDPGACTRTASRSAIISMDYFLVSHKVIAIH
jgi:hypothetical protein